MSTAAQSPIRRALVSVSDKSQLSTLADLLIAQKVEVLSTGGTFKALQGAGVAAVKVSDFTGAPEILGGRVKTLHPKIHGGILALPTPEHESELEIQGIPPIDLVVVNLYPFRETIAKDGCTFADAIENIDIGGPTMVRAAAKNWNRVTVIVDPSDYASLGEVLRENDGMIPEAFRRAMARKAFAHTAAYDAAIATYLSRFDDGGEEDDIAAIPSGLFIAGESVAELRYGENPHQSASFYACEHNRDEAVGLDKAIQHQGKALSYNNLLDADAALGLIRDLKVLGKAAAVFKHVSPCGAAVGLEGDSLADVFVKARQADAESAFGGIVSLTEEVDEAMAEKLVETFLEVVIAPGYSAGALERLKAKKNLRVLEIPEMFGGAGKVAPLRLRSVAGGRVGPARRRDSRIGGGSQAGQRTDADARRAHQFGARATGRKVGAFQRDRVGQRRGDRRDRWWPDFAGRSGSSSRCKGGREDEGVGYGFGRLLPLPRQHRQCGRGWHHGDHSAGWIDSRRRGDRGGEGEQHSDGLHRRAPLPSLIETGLARNEGETRCRTSAEKF